MPVCRYYHATHTRLPVGQEVVARLGRSTDPFEQLVEKYRPASAPSRLAAFFLTDDPSHNEALGAINTRYYHVEPVGVAARVDYDWLYEAKEYFLSGDRDADIQRRILTCIRGYWSGKRSDTFRAWEWVAPRIHVCRQLSDAERARAMQAGENRHGFPVLMERNLRASLLADPHYRRQMATFDDDPPVRSKRSKAPEPTTARKTARKTVRKPLAAPPAAKRSVKPSASSDFERQLRRLQGAEPPSSRRGARKRRRS